MSYLIQIRINNERVDSYSVSDSDSDSKGEVDSAQPCI